MMEPILHYIILLGLLVSISALIRGRVRAVKYFSLGVMFYVLGYSLYSLTFMNFVINFIIALVTVLTIILTLEIIRIETPLRGYEYMACTALPISLGLILHIGTGIEELILLITFLAVATLTLTVLVAARGLSGHIGAGVRYLIFSGIGKALMIIGIAVSLSIHVTIGIALILAGFAMELGLFPFHGWVPDTFARGSPFGIALLGLYSKVISIIVLTKILLIIAKPAIYNIENMIALGLCIATISIIGMYFGNIAGLTARTIGRVLAYSTISHVAYAYAAVAVAILGMVLNLWSEVVYPALAIAIYELFATGLAKLGSFSPFSNLENSEIRIDVPRAYISKTGAYSAVVLMLSLLGVPPLIGFWPKLFLFLVCVRLMVTPYWLVGLVIAISLAVNSAISAIYYARLIKAYLAMIRKRCIGEVVTLISMLLVVILGIVIPIQLLNWLQQLILI